MTVDRVAFTKTFPLQGRRDLPVKSMRDGKRIPEYSAWKDIRYRCYNPKDHAYKDYGGRGIRVCDRWKDSFQNFMEDMGFKPTPEHTIDRIDNNGDYEPNNCRWATMDIQSNNRRDNHWIEHNGVRMTVAMWSKHLKVSSSNLLSNKKRTESESIEHYIKNGKRKSPRK